MTDKLCRISLFYAILSSIIGTSSASIADSRVKSTYASAYNQVMTVQQQNALEQDIQSVQTASATETLPIEVEDAKLAENIKNNTASSVTINDLEQCSMIDIRGVFKWGVPQSGMRQTTQPQCMAVVDLVDAETKKVLATTTVAAGDAIKCNIDEFPETGYQPALAEVVLPADNPPTEKDVEKALNKEQKQNAGFKIAAAAIIGGLAGNALSPKGSDDSKLLGTSKKQMLGSAIGALSAGGIMAASSYSGKVAGETIKSGAVNATAGMLVANMGAGLSDSNSVLATTKCIVDKKERDCVIGHFYKKNTNSGFDIGRYNYYTTDAGNSTYQCNKQGKDCKPFHANLQGIHLKSESTTTPSVALSSIKPADFTDKFVGVFIRDGEATDKTSNDNNERVYYQIDSAWVSEPTKMAYAVVDGMSSKAFGYKVSDFDKFVANDKVTGYYVRYNNTTTVGDQLDVKDGKKMSNEDYSFTPDARSSEDGSIIDLSNEARAKATMAGAGAGAALGGFVGYQGAQGEISERLMTALNEYSASLSNFYCTTGGRFLALYNGFAEIPQSRSSATQDQ